jgi:hypothetical protein
MMVLTGEERKERRQQSLVKTKAAMTKAEKLHQAFSAGRPPLSEFRTPSEAVRSAVVLLRGIQGTMSDPKFSLNPDDCAVHVAYVDPSFTGAFTMPVVIGQEADLIAKLESQPVIMLGLLFALKDRERDPEGNDAVVGVRPFIVTPRTVQWMTDLRERAETGH